MILRRLASAISAIAAMYYLAHACVWAINLYHH